MAATATPTAPKFEATTARQVQTITDLASELGIEVVMPRTKAVARRLIFKLIKQVEERHGDRLPPTSKQLRFLVERGEQRGKPYAVPKTRREASARIAKIVAADEAAAERAAA